MKELSFSGIGEAEATFRVSGQVKRGQVVKLSGGGEVSPCQAGDTVFGVVKTVGDGCAAVQVRGFSQVSTASELSVGSTTLAADGDGGVKTVTTGGKACWVVDNDTEHKTAVILL